MTAPAVSLILCTVRPAAAYAHHPEWDCIGKVVHDLAAQVEAPTFELVIVDGISGPERQNRAWGMLWEYGDGQILWHKFDIRRIPPRSGSPWVRMHKVAISAYRNTGIAAARGELIVNLDDACELPPNFVATFWNMWRETGHAAAMCWPDKGDKRELGPLENSEQFAYGFSSYPRDLLLSLNGYDEAYDGARGLEDMDLSVRARMAGLRQTLVALDGFDHGSAQGGHDPSAIDPVRPIVKCCNAAFQCQRVWRKVLVANRAELWTREALQRLVGPCVHLHGEMCGHHRDTLRCAYYDDGQANGVPECAPLNTEARGFARSLDPEAAVVFDDPPVIDLRALAREYASG